MKTLKKRFLYCIGTCLMLIVYGCIEEQILPYNDAQIDGEYFVECYLEPNELYKLTATKLQSLDQDYILDYSLYFKANIDSIKLYQSLYTDPQTGYVYNYGSAKRFVPKNDKVSLTLISEKLDTIKGETTIPEEIDILNFNNNNNGLEFDFLLSKNPLHNYFMISVDMYQNDTVQRIVKLLDYSQREMLDTISYKYAFKNDQKKEGELNLVIRRLTKENYKYQQSIENAKDANRDNLILPSALVGNLKNATGIFTCYTTDSILVQCD